MKSENQRYQDFKEFHILLIKELYGETNPEKVWNVSVDTRDANKTSIILDKISNPIKFKSKLKETVDKILSKLPTLRNLISNFTIKISNYKLIIDFPLKELTEKMNLLNQSPIKLVETFLKESLESEETQIFKDLIGKIPNSSIIDDYEIRMAANGDLTVSRQGTPIGRKKKGEWETVYPQTFKLFKK